MDAFIEPNIHPVLVHFAFALTVTAAGLYGLSQIPYFARRVPVLGASADVILALALPSVVLTIAAGLQAYYTVAHDGPSHDAMTVHRNWALSSAGVLVLVVSWRWLTRKADPSIAFVAAMFVVTGLFVTTAWWGGHIVYGFGLGVRQLPAVEGAGHDHHHSAGESDDHDGVGAHHDTGEGSMMTDDPVKTSDTMEPEQRQGHEAPADALPDEDEAGHHHSRDDAHSLPHAH